MRTEVMRTEIMRLLERRPFLPFEINIENGDRVVVEHPENLAMGAGNNEGKFSSRVHVLGSSDVIFCTTFEAISSVAEIDRGEPMGG